MPLLVVLPPLIFRPKKLLGMVNLEAMRPRQLRILDGPLEGLGAFSNCTCDPRLD